MASVEASPANESPANGGMASTAAEITNIKATFPNRCRVICDVGKYNNVITVQPENLDVTIKFQLTAAYPTVIPDIVVRSSSMPAEAIADVESSLLGKASNLIGQPMIQSLVKEAEATLHALGLKPGKVWRQETDMDKKTQRKKKQKNKHKVEEDEIEEKLPPMKTADDVIKRIIWDENLDKDLFLVGYIDRFRGLLEKYFSAFSWEDLASVDYDVLAVPKHRIQYFKYKYVKVWDKPRRVDNVFGSANGTKTIDRVMMEVEEAEQKANRIAADDQQTDQNEEDEDDNTDLSDSDSDDFEVTIGQSVNIGVTVTGSAESATNSKENADKEAEGEFDPYWRDKLRPNYFLCIRVTNEKIMDQISEVQDYLMEKEPLFAECCIPGASLHITLSTLGLDTAEQLTHCMQTLEKIKPELSTFLPKSKLKVSGVSHFYNRVVYAQIKYEQDFTDFCDHLKLLLREGGVQIRDGYEFVPHITIMKTTRPVSRLRGSKNIPCRFYSPFADTEFGDQDVDSVYLCSMGEGRRGDGFYLTPLELHFSSQID